MSANTTDKVTDTRNAGRPVSTTVASPRNSGANSLSCNSLTGWPTASKVHFVTYQIDANSLPIAGTQLDCSGIVSGNTIGSLTVIDGTDNGNSVGDIVEMLPTAAWGQDLSDALTSTHNRSGGLKTAITLTQPTIGDFTNATHTHTNTVGGGTLGPTAVPALSLASQTLANPYKFSVYKTTAQNVGTSATKVNFETEEVDTNNNYDNATNFRYTIPVTGFYQINFTVAMSSAGSGTNIGAYLYKNGSPIWLQNVDAGVGGSPGVSHAKLWSLTAGDFLEVFVATAAAAKALDVSVTTNNSFSGFLVSNT